MHSEWEPFSFGKFIVCGCGPQKCRNLFIYLFIYAQKQITKFQIMGTLVLLQGDSLKRGPELIIVKCAVI
jgi:hypothetical protein